MIFYISAHHKYCPLYARRPGGNRSILDRPVLVQAQWFAGIQIVE